MYQPSTVLLTGVAGFICSNVAVYLVNKYPEIMFIGIDKISYCSNEKNIEEISQKENFRFVKVDITNFDHINQLFLDNKIDTIMHFAAYTHVDHSFGNSIIFTQNNVVGTHILLEVAKQHKINRFIHVSTDEVYGSKNSISLEDSILDPTNPYAASKAAAEHIVRSYHHSFDLPVIITRGNNVYGSKQYPEKVIPKFCLRLLKGEKCQIQGSGKQLRSFLHVDDVARAFEIILFKGEVGEIYNIGSNEEYSIIEIATKLTNILKLNNTNEKWIEFIKDRDFNDQRYYICNSKLQNLGWQPLISFDKGLEMTVDWYCRNLDHWKENDIQAALNL